MNYRIVSAAIFLVLIIPAAVFSSEKSEYLNKARKASLNKQYRECAGFYEEAIKKGADSEDTYYEAACCFARAGDKDKAFQYLDEAIKKGFTDVDNLRRDPDLKSIRKDKRWQGVVSRCDEAQQAYLETINKWLFMMYQTDQKDRANYKDGDDWSEIAKRDSLRRARVKAIIENKQLKMSDDYFHAAMIMHHGKDTSEYMMANELAMRAVELDSTNDMARWLIAASADRYLLNAGRPQIYGTQYNYVRGRWTLDPIDTTIASDAIREFYRVPSLENIRQRVVELNEKK